jgi:glycerol-3-phosphate acyltransferase PlsY
MTEMLAILLGYFLGSIPFGFLIPKLYGIKDIRKVGSGNIGATNVWRIAGPIPAILVLIGDVGKGVLAVTISSYLASGLVEIEYLKLASGFAAIMGHIIPIFLLFKGGKGVNTALGVMTSLLPIPALISLIVFIAVVMISRYISLGSIIAAIALVAIVVVEKIFLLRDIHPVYIPVSILLALLIIFTHRSNIGRLLAGTENRFQLHSKKSSGVKKNG